MNPRGRQGARAPLASRSALAALALAAGAAACSPTEGYVEAAWTIVDRKGEPIYPNGVLSDTCSFRGPTSPGGDDRDLALRVELRLCEPGCEGGCEDPACLVTDPLRFQCLSARGSATVPASESPYIFQVEVIAEVGGDPACACALTPECAQIPGPRQRMVRPGLVTDLQVYQLILDVADPSRAAIDLSECCPLPDSCA